MNRNQKLISPENLGSAIVEGLELYRHSVRLTVDRCGAKAINNLARKTKDTAPFNAKHHGRHYVDCIATKKTVDRTNGNTYTWYVKAPCHRLTHLLVDGHRIVDSKGNEVGHASPNPFLKNAVEEVTEQYQNDVIEAVKKLDS